MNAEELDAFYQQISEDENIGFYLMSAHLLMFPVHRARESDSDLEHAKRSFELLDLWYQGDSGPERNQALLDESRDWIAENSKTFDILRRTRTLEQGSYARDFERGFWGPLNGMTELRSLARAVRIRVLVEAHGGDGGAALDAFYDIAPIVRSLDGEVSIFWQLVRISVIRIALDSTDELLEIGCLSGSQLTSLADELSSFPATEYMYRGLIGYRATGLLTLEALTEWSVTSDVAWFVAANQLGTNKSFRLPPIRMMSVRYQIPRYLETMRRIIELERYSVAERQEVKEALARELDENSMGPIVGQILDSNLLNPDTEATRSDTMITMALSAIAIERCRLVHGHIPDDLSDLVPEFLDSVPLDPFTESPMKYRQTSDGYVVYSFAENGVDDFDSWVSVGMPDEDRDDYRFHVSR